MIDGSEGAVWSSNFAASISEALESLRRCHLVDQMPVNVEKDCAIVLLVHDMVLEDLVVQSLGGFHSRRHGECVGYNFAWHK